MNQPPPGDRHQQQQYPPPGQYAQQPPNWRPPGPPQKPPQIQDQIKRALATTRGKIIAIALVVAAITTIVVVAVVGSKVAFGDSGESYDLGHGVHITLDTPDGWKAATTTDDKGRGIVLQREGDPVSVDDAFTAVAKVNNDVSPDVALDVVIIRASECSDLEPDALESQGYSRRGAWMVTPSLPGRVDDYRSLTRSASRSSESCSGYTPIVVGMSGTETGTPSTAATDIVGQITDGEIITSVEIK